MAQKAADTMAQKAADTMAQKAADPITDTFEAADEANYDKVANSVFSISSSPSKPVLDTSPAEEYIDLQMNPMADVVHSQQSTQHSSQQSTQQSTQHSMSDSQSKHAEIHSKFIATRNKWLNDRLFLDEETGEKYTKIELDWYYDPVDDKIVSSKKKNAIKIRYNPFFLRTDLKKEVKAAEALGQTMKCEHVGRFRKLLEANPDDFMLVKLSDDQVKKNLGHYKTEKSQLSDYEFLEFMKVKPKEMKDKIFNPCTGIYLFLNFNEHTHCSFSGDHQNYCSLKNELFKKSSFFFELFIRCSIIK